MRPLRREVLKGLFGIPVIAALLPESLVAALSPDHATPSVALSVIRMFNTLEATYKIKEGRYASEGELIRSPLLDHMVSHTSLMDKLGGHRFLRKISWGSPNIVPDWVFGIQQTRDRDHYLIWILEGAHFSNHKAGRILYASDESGVIRETRAHVLEQPTSYAPIMTAFPGVFPLGGASKRTFAKRASGAFQRVAFSTMQADFSPELSDCGCGNCFTTLQPFCFDYGTEDCVWCCCGSCEDCLVCAAADGVGGCFCG